MEYASKLARAEHYRRRAQDALSQAELTRSEPLKAGFERIARGWEALALQVEQGHAMGDAAGVLSFDIQPGHSTFQK